MNTQTEFEYIGDQKMQESNCIGIAFTRPTGSNPVSINGYPLEDEWGGKTALTDGDYPEVERKIMLLSNENETLNGKIGHLEERVAVLERIVTDKAGRLSEEIERLR